MKIKKNMKFQGKAMMRGLYLWKTVVSFLETSRNKLSRFFLILSMIWRDSNYIYRNSPCRWSNVKERGKRYVISLADGGMIMMA